MKGHEYPRSLLKAMLAVQVPARLSVSRASTGEDWPIDPRSYQLADSLPMKEEHYPCVLITASSASPNTSIQAGLGQFIYEYTLTVQVAVVASRHGGEELASVGRDRILLAVREALMLNAELADDCFSVVRNLNEQTGAAVENMQGKPMSLGNITFSVRVVEELEDPILDGSGDPAVVASHAETVTAVDASRTLP